MTKVSEFFGASSKCITQDIIEEKLLAQLCPFTGNRCFKVRKSEPEISIGTCTVSYGKEQRDIIICPNRLLQNKQVFIDCVHLLTKHEPGNEFHIVSEVSIPGGSVDYFLVSAKHGKVKDFVGTEFQTLDTTGTVYCDAARLSSGVMPKKTNLLNKYLPTSSAHIESIHYSKENNEFVIVFYSNPESWKKYAKFTFTNINNYNCEILDENNENLIDLAIGFDLSQGCYCIHTTTREITFSSDEEPLIEYIA